MTTETQTTVAESLLALSTESTPARIAESRLPKLKNADEVRDFLNHEAEDTHPYDGRMMVAHAVKAPKLAEAIGAVDTLHEFYHNLTPVMEVRDELDGRLLTLVKRAFGDDLRDLAYRKLNLSSRYEGKTIW